MLSDTPLVTLAPIPSDATPPSDTLHIRFSPPPAELAAIDDGSWQLVVPSAPPPNDETPVVRLWRHRTAGHYRYLYRDGAAFTIDATGLRIFAQHPDDMSNEDVCSYLLGPVFALVLRLRGIVCLHASAASVGDVAVAFLGSAHAGKSTLAAAFSLAGYPALSDDTATLIPRDDHFWVAADSPRLNLWPRSAELLFGDAAALPRLSDTWDKRFLDLRTREGAPSTPGARQDGQRLGVLYELAVAESAQSVTHIVGLGGHQALVVLTQHARASALLDPAHRPRELDVLADVMASVMVRRVERAIHAKPQDVRNAILEDLRGLGLAPRATAPCAPEPPPAADR